MVICLELGANDLHMVQLMPPPPIISCFIKIQTGLTFLVPAYPGCPRKEAIKRVSVCQIPSLDLILSSATNLLPRKWTSCALS